MIKIFVYATNKKQAEQAVKTLKSAGAEHVEPLESLKLTTRQPKENRYLFICETPAEKLTSLAPQVLLENDYAQELDTWYANATATIAAFNAQKKRSILVSISKLNDLNALIELINDQWALNLILNSDSDPQEPNSQGDPLLAYIVQNLVNQTPELLSLADEIAKLSGFERETIYETDALKAFRGNNRSINQLNVEKQALVKSAADLKNQLKDITEEAELVLNQLHQVQEELEHYFIKYKEADLQREKQQIRWQKILSSYPNYVAFESIKATPKDSDDHTISWSIIGLENTNISRPRLEFETFIEAGILGYRFNQDSGGKQASLKIWPEFAKDLSALEFIPVGKGEAKTLRAKLLKELSSSDWQLIQVIPKLIEQATSEGAITPEDQQKIIVALHKLSRSIQFIPKTLRYDAVTLKNNQVNPDYEHLWLVLHNVSFGTCNWPRFEFRLGAAGICPGKFSTLPKLELPLIDGKIKSFQSWYEDSYDDYGSKFELRFDNSRKLFDDGAWSKLSADDQSLMVSLISSIPDAVSHLNLNKITIARSWADWIGLAEGMNNVLKALLESKNQNPM